MPEAQHRAGRLASKREAAEARNASDAERHDQREPTVVQCVPPNRKTGSREPSPGEASAMTPKITARYARGGRNAQLTAGAASIGRLLLTD